MTRSMPLGAAFACALAMLVSVSRAPAQDRCFVEVDGPSRAVVQQPVFFEVVVGWDREWFDGHAVALSRQRTDAPLHLDLPWLGASADYEAKVSSPGDGAPTNTVALGDRIVTAARMADVARGGRPFAQLLVRVRLMPLRAGALELGAARARYAFATEFREHLLRGREPVDRQEAFASSGARRLDVRRLVGEAPADYGGAVGSFDVEWLSGGVEVPVGRSFEVSMTVRGGEDTNLAQLRLPTLPALDGFHVQGVIEESAADGRRFSIELVPLRAGLDSVDGLSFVSYAPDSDEFVRIRGGAVPVRVKPRRQGVALPERIEELIRRDARARSGAADTLRWVFVGLAAGGLVLFRFDRGRRRRGRLEASMGALRAALVARDASAIASAYESLIARAGGGETFASPISWDSLTRRGVTADGTAKLKELHAALDQARFGGLLPEAVDVLTAAETLFRAAKG